MTTTNSLDFNNDIESSRVSLMKTMLENQNTLNSKLSEMWREQDYPFLDAIMVEATELFDHTEWKWWKEAKDINQNQVKLEIIDIWHFVMSIALSFDVEVDALSEQVSELMNTSITTASDSYVSWDYSVIREFTKSLIAFSADPSNSPMYNQRVPFWAPLVYLTGALAGLVGMTYQELYCLYIGKSVLNEFRWEIGYGKGYQKIWFGKEDNEHLVEIIQSTPLPVQGDDFKASLKRLLSDKYTQVQTGISG